MSCDKTRVGKKEKMRFKSMKRVNSVEYLGKRQTYDVHVFHNNHNFLLSNGLVSHNSGKSLSAIRVMKLRNQITFVNQNIKLPKAKRLQVKDIVNEEILEPESPKSKPKTQLTVNWQFWKEQLDKYGGFDIFLDEVAQFASARSAMSNHNKKVMEWIAQIRKILGASELHDIILVTQKLDGIDITIRDFAHEVTHCQKFYTIGGFLIPATNQNVHLAQTMPTKVWDKGKLVTKMLPKVTIVQYKFSGEYAVNDYFEFRFQKKKTYSSKSFFVGNPYMQYYDSYEILDFTPNTYL